MAMQAECDEWKKTAHRWERDAAEQHAALDRVWFALGNPPYDELKGKDIGECVTDLKRRIAVLEAALKPFKEQADRYATYEGKDVPDSFWIYVELGHCRQARAALNAGSEGETE